MSLDKNANEIVERPLRGRWAVPFFTALAALGLYLATLSRGVFPGAPAKQLVWKSGDRKDKCSIEGIETVRVSSSGELSPKDTVSDCLDEMLKTAGVYVDTAELLKEGMTSLDIMKENMTGAVPLALSGCSTDAMLYYVSNGSPVMAMVEDDAAVLITGYDDSNLIIYDPVEEKPGKKRIRDAANWFAYNGNRFLTYVR